MTQASGEVEDNGGISEANGRVSQLPGYQKLSKIFEGIETILYKSIRQQDQRPVI